MRYMKQGGIVNFLTNLSNLQRHILNKLQSEDCRDIPIFTFYAETILSLQLALATAFKVKLKNQGSYTVSYDGDKNYSIIKVHEPSMKALGGGKSRLSVDYTRCPRVLAVCGHIPFL